MQEAPSPHDADPLQAIEADMRALMKQCGSLSGQLEGLKTDHETSTRKMLLAFIDVADAFENLFARITPKIDAADPQAKAWVNNFRTISRLLARALSSAGVSPIETVVGTKANPHWHNAAEVVEQPDRDDDTIVEEIRRGYLWNGKLLRPADVKAVKN